MKDRKERKLTLEVIAEQPLANWVWDFHLDNEAFNGLKIISISEGHPIQPSIEADWQKPAVCKNGCHYAPCDHFNCPDWRDPTA